MTAAAATPSPGANEIVHGFAKNVPLAVALREILPSGYGFSVDQDVDLGILVSFTGGKPWRDTLKDTLGPAGLVMHEQAQMVQIGYPEGKDLASASVPASSKTPASPAVTPVLTPPPAPAASDALAAISQQAPAEQTWNAEPGDSLHKVLETWSRRANVEFDWMAEYDYPLQASVHLTGNFESAVRDLLTGFETAHPQPIAELHSNPKAGQMVLVVTTRGNSSD